MQLHIYILGQLTQLKFPYPRVIDEPNMYDSIVVQAESMAAEDFTWGPDFSVCILELGNIDDFFGKNILFLNENVWHKLT